MQETLYFVEIKKNGEVSFSSDQMTDSEIQDKMTEIFGLAVIGFTAQWYAAKIEGDGVVKSLRTKCNLWSDGNGPNLYEIEVTKV